MSKTDGGRVTEHLKLTFWRRHSFMARSRFTTKERTQVGKKTRLLKERSQNHQARDLEGSSTCICKSLRIKIAEHW